jgi:hypothetical protein
MYFTTFVCMGRPQNITLLSVLLGCASQHGTETGPSIPASIVVDTECTITDAGGERVDEETVRRTIDLRCDDKSAAELVVQIEEMTTPRSRTTNVSVYDGTVYRQITPGLATLPFETAFGEHRDAIVVQDAVVLGNPTHFSGIYDFSTETFAFSFMGTFAGIMNYTEIADVVLPLGILTEGSCPTDAIKYSTGPTASCYLFDLDGKRTEDYRSAQVQE